MASMTRKQRAEHYLKLLFESSNKQATFKLILDELNGLVYSKTSKPLSKQDKLAIIEEIEKALEQYPQRSYESRDLYSNTQASDNSGVIDIIGALKRGVKD